MTNIVANIFGSSPVMPLENHIGVAYDCASRLRPLFEAAIQGDWQAADAVRAEIDELEHQADEIKKEIRLHLPKSLFMPVPRQDLLELLLVQDRIANRARDVAGIVTQRRMAVPSAIAESLLEFVDQVVAAARQARESVRELDELFTAGFKGAEVKLVSALIEELDRLQSPADQPPQRRLCGGD